MGYTNIDVPLLLIDGLGTPGLLVSLIAVIQLFLQSSHLQIFGPIVYSFVCSVQTSQPSFFLLKNYTNSSTLLFSLFFNTYFITMKVQ